MIASRLHYLIQLRFDWARNLRAIPGAASMEHQRLAMDPFSVGLDLTGVGLRHRLHFPRHVKAQQLVLHADVELLVVDGGMRPARALDDGELEGAVELVA